MKASVPATTTISVFTRHVPECPKKDNPQWKQCRCRKSVYIYANGKVSYLSAKTRSWTQAEKVAQAERDKRDPVKLELARIAAQEQAKKDVVKARESSIAAALDQWVAGLKTTGATAKAYATFKKAVLTWAASQGYVMLSEVTPDALDAWAASWTQAANTQAFRMTRVKSFFRWATALRKLEFDPAGMLRSVKAENKEETQPLTPEQFAAVLAATYQYDADHRVDWRFGVEMRAIFLVQRWTGLRLSDVLMLPRSAVQGNRIVLVTQKTDCPLDRVVPEAVTEALAAVPVRKTMHPDQFFWSRQCDHRVLAGMWTPRIRELNQYLNFRFHSHMLRDTYAVELLLAGVSLDKVSRLLTHKSTRTTERHYAPWVQSREKQLEEEAMIAMRKMGAEFHGDSKPELLH